MTEELEKDIINEINNFRKNPNFLMHQLEILKKGISRLRPKDPFLSEIDNFISQLPSIESLPPLSLNKQLCQIAKTESKKFAYNYKNYNNFLQNKSLKGIVPDGYLSQNICLIADNEIEEAETFLTKILLNKMDRNKLGRNALTSPETSQLGISIYNNDGDNYLILIFADIELNDEENDKVPGGDLTELKMAFDLYDKDGSQKIRIQDALDAMKSMKFDEKNPDLYLIIEELKDQEWCSWPRFASHVTARITDRSTDEGLATLFNLFIDNPKKKTITFETFKRICQEVGESLSDDEMKTILTNTTENGNEITLQDFISFMKSSD